MADFPAELTPAWLTGALREHGHLARGRARRIDILHMSETLPSWHARLAVAYSPEAPPAAPTRLFLKMPKPEALEAAERETMFYATIAPRMPTLPLVPWYGAGTVAGIPYLLLADVLATHRPWDDGLPPWSHLERMAGVLAEVHAWWWERPDLGRRLGEPPDETVGTMFARAGERYAELADRLGDRLTADHRRILERYLARALTLCHPDNHHANFLFPRRPGGQAYLIDWQVYRRWWGPSDLAALVTRSVAPDQQRPGDALLRGYHRQLIEYGVTNYPWEACRRDYRLGVIDTLRVVLSMRRHPARALQNLVAIVPEFRRQECEELLG